MFKRKANKAKVEEPQESTELNAETEADQLGAETEAPVDAPEGSDTPEGAAASEESIFAARCFTDTDTSDPAVQVWVTLLNRENCHLCQDALNEIGVVVEQLKRSTIVAEMLGPVDTWLRIIQRNIDEDQDLKSRFDQEVPVVFINGRQNSYWHVNHARLFADVLKAMKAGNLLDEIRLELIRPKHEPNKVPRSKPLKRRKRV